MRAAEATLCFPLREGAATAPRASLEVNQGDVVADSLIPTSIAILDGGGFFFAELSPVCTPNKKGVFEAHGLKHTREWPNYDW